MKDVLEKADTVHEKRLRHLPTVFRLLEFLEAKLPLLLSQRPCPSGRDFYRMETVGNLVVVQSLEGSSNEELLASLAEAQAAARFIHRFQGWHRIRRIF